MRALILLALIGSIAHAQPRAIGFDHMVHARNIDVRNEPAIACAKCHPNQNGRLAGRPDHATCFGACHGPVPVAGKPPGDRMKVCTACHAEAAFAATGPKAKYPVPYPPYDLDQDFAVVLGHRQHKAIACSQCHNDPGAPKPAKVAHARCASCHDGVAGHGTPMSKCESCHERATGKPQPPQLDLPTLPISFSHKTHAARGAMGKACTSCHTQLTLSDAPILPRPDAKTCSTGACHDGKAAFPITTSCTKCHATPPVKSFEVARPTKRFSHAQHDPSTKGLACASCHRLATNGEILSGNHASCSGCHDEFGARAPTICGACHSTTEPWRKLVADRGPAEASEFGAAIDHTKHPNVACTQCHALRTATRELRPPRGHASCATANCHAMSAGPEPRMTACEGCHQRGLVEARDAKRLAAAWTVRDRFSHGVGHQVACSTCHDDMTSVTVLSMASPAKARCATCHDGTAAFKVTGTGCARCHGKQ